MRAEDRAAVGAAWHADAEAVLTGMTGTDHNFGADHDGILTPEAVAACVVEGLAGEQFLILPHPTVAGYMRAKARDPDLWLSKLRHIRRGFLDNN